LLALFAIGFTASDQTDLPETTPTDTSGIPQDQDAEPNPEVTQDEVTTNIPNINVVAENDGQTLVFRIDMTGIKNREDLEWLRLYGTGIQEQNIWVEIDDEPKGVDVYNTIDQQQDKIVPADLVFTVDNSGSMSEEANAIARDIISWSQLLAESGLDIRFGLVGYGGYIDGAIDFTDATTLSTYLNRASGTSRTKGFGGDNATTLSTNASNWPRTGGSVDTRECSASAIRFANEYFTFRQNANRIYVNFTDEPNQPNGIVNYSVKFFAEQDNWSAANGTVHTVWSGGTSTADITNWNYNESPWFISEYTGGTIIKTNSSFTQVTLSNLPVTAAMQNSYILRIHGIADMLNDGLTHRVHITVISADGKVKADKVFYVKFES